MTTEDNEDQEALAIVAGALRPILGSNAALYEIDKAEAQRILSALSEAGYTVVKTEALRELENAYVFEQVRAGNFGPIVPVPESDTLEGGANG